MAIAGSDAGAGVQRITYTTDGSDPTSSGTATTVAGANASFNITTLGTTTVKWIAEDNVGNISTVTTQTVKLDTSAPTAPTLGFSGLSNAYYPGSGSTVYVESGASGGFTVTGSGSTDGESGVAGYTYPSLGGGFSNTAGAYTFNSATTQSGSVTAQNNAGLSSTGTGFTARVDGSAPTSSITCNSNPCGAGWTTSVPVNIDITGDDGTGSGVKQIVYTTDGSDPTTSGTATTVNASTASFQLSTPQTIKWFAVDDLGNASSVQSITLQIDGTAPTAPTGFTFTSPSHAYWPGSGTTVFFQGGGTGGFTVNGSRLDRSRVRRLRLQLPVARHRLDEHRRRLHLRRDGGHAVRLRHRAEQRRARELRHQLHRPVRLVGADELRHLQHRRLLGRLVHELARRDLDRRRRRERRVRRRADRLHDRRHRAGDQRQRRSSPTAPRSTPRPPTSTSSRSARPP